MYSVNESKIRVQPRQVPDVHYVLLQAKRETTRAMTVHVR